MPSGAADSALIVAASRARTQEVIVAGLLHDLNGPLNTLRLTLELLERVLASRVSGDADASNPRVRRYLDTLREESARMTVWSRSASAAVASGTATERQGLRALLDEALRLLRHHAVLSEVRLEAGAATERAAAGDVAADIEVADVAADIEVADVAATRALLATLVYAAIAVAPAGAVVQARIAAHGAQARVRVAVTPAAVPADAERAFARPQEAPDSALAVDLVSLRAQTEALQGHAFLHADAQGATLEIALPRA